MLFHLRQLARLGTLVCFEVDTKVQGKVQNTFKKIHSEPGFAELNATLVPDLFTPGLLPARTVDVFTSSHVLEHLTDPCILFAEVARVLKPGGLFFTEIPNDNVLKAKGAKKKKKAKDARLCGTFHRNFFGGRNWTQDYGRFKMAVTAMGHFVEVKTTLAPNKNSLRYLFRRLG